MILFLLLVSLLERFRVGLVVAEAGGVGGAGGGRGVGGELVGGGRSLGLEVRFGMLGGGSVATLLSGSVGDGVVRIGGSCNPSLRPEAGFVAARWESAGME